MTPYAEAVEQLRENGYVSDKVVNQLTSEELTRAVAEASAPA